MPLKTYAIYILIGLILGCWVLAAWLWPPLEAQPRWVQVGTPVLLLGTFAVPWVFDRANIHEQTVSISVTVVATFFGAFLAFLMNTLQGDVTGRATLHDTITGVMKELDAAYLPFWLTSVSPNEITRESFQGLSGLLGSSLAAPYLSEPVTSELAFAAESLRNYSAVVADSSKEMSKRQEYLKRYRMALESTYLRLCMLNYAYDHNGGTFDSSLVHAAAGQVLSLAGMAPGSELPKGAEACRKPPDLRAQLPAVQ